MVRLTNAIVDREPLSDFDARETNFRLSEVWSCGQISPADNLLLSFDLESVVEMRRVDVEQFIGVIWYSTADDLFIFDHSGEWALLVHHSGLIYVSK